MKNMKGMKFFVLHLMCNSFENIEQQSKSLVLYDTDQAFY
jgi:hypothetical protein